MGSPSCECLNLACATLINHCAPVGADCGHPKGVWKVETNGRVFELCSGCAQWWSQVTKYEAFREDIAGRDRVGWFEYHRYRAMQGKPMEQKEEVLNGITGTPTR